MHRLIVRAVVLVLLCCAVCQVGAAVSADEETARPGTATVTATGQVADGHPAGDSRARIVGLYPNPTAREDRGEFVTVAFPSGANLSAYTLADEHATVPLSPLATNATAANATGATVGISRLETAAARTLTFSTDVGLTAWLGNRSVAPLSSSLRLANSGEVLRLQRGGDTVDEVQYASAPEGRVYNATADRWERLGGTDRPVVTARGGQVEAFVLPDAADRAVEFLASAGERVLLAGYTFSSGEAVDALVTALERGVTVEVLVDGDPVGGMTGESAVALSTLDRAGATVRVLAGDRTRYRYHHAKYAVVDDRALVTTENWKPSGTGGAANRGWAVITDQRPVVRGLVETYRADTSWVDTLPWREHDPTLVESDPKSGEYPRAFGTQTLPVERTQLLVTPDNAAGRLHELVDGAEESIDIKQVRIGDREFPLLQAVLAAATRGVRVRILLSSAWYVEEENRQLAAWLRDQAETADLPLSVRLARPGDAFERIHAKGVVVDNETAVVGSINWNNNSLLRNREVALAVTGESAAGYFRAVFAADWARSDGTDSATGLPLGMALAVLAGAVAAILGVKRVRFD